MNSIGDYDDMLGNLSRVNSGFKPPPVLDEVINDKKVVAKTAVEGISTQMLGGQVSKTLKVLLKKNQSQLEKLGLKSSDIDDLVESASDGDLESTGVTGMKLLTQAINKTVGNGIKKGGQFLEDLKSNLTDLKSAAKDKLSDLTEAAKTKFGNAPQQVLDDAKEDLFGSDPSYNLKLDKAVSERAEKLAKKELAKKAKAARKLQKKKSPAEPDEPEDAPDVDPAVRRVAPDAPDDDDTPTSLQEPKTLNQSAQEEVNAQQKAASDDVAQQSAEDTKTDVPDPAKDLDEAGKNLGDLDEESKAYSDAKKAIKVGEEVEGGGAEFDPIEAAVGGLIALGGVISGAFIKTHHTVNRAPPAPNPVNFSAQLY